jgi:hypothetical protein
VIHALAFLAIVWICWAQPRVAAFAGALFLGWLWAASNPPPDYKVWSWAIFAVTLALFALAFYPKRSRHMP